MEQKKTLWIIAAVGVFLLVVLGGACIVYSPSKKSAPVVASAKPAPEKQPANGWSNPPQNPPAPDKAPENDFQRPDFYGPSTGKVNDMVVVSENTTVYDLNKNSSPAPAETAAPQSTTIDLNALKRELAAEVTAAANNQVQPQNINITVTMPEKEAPAPVIVTPDYNAGKTQETEAKKAEPAEEKPASKPVEKKETTAVAKTTATAKPAASTKPAANTSAKPAATASKPAATTAKPAAPKTVTRYWVQVAAYTNKKTAETAREALTSNKITSDIFTYEDAKGKLFYRVRVGPYTTKSEAEYWQAKINKLDDFKNSQSYVATTTD